MSKHVQRSTPTQQPTIPWSSLLRQRPRQCLTLRLTQQGWENYQELSCSLSISYLGLVVGELGGVGLLERSGQGRDGVAKGALQLLMNRYG